MTLTVTWEFQSQPNRPKSDFREGFSKTDGRSFTDDLVHHFTDGNTEAQRGPRT